MSHMSLDRIPREVRDKIDEALAFVRQHPQHDLSPGYREVIYIALGSLLRVRVSTGDLAAYPQGPIRAANLDLATVRHVLPIWTRIAPENDLPQELLATAEAVLNGRADAEEAGQMSGDAFYEIGGHWGATSGEQTSGIAVGFAAAQCLLTAVVAAKALKRIEAFRREAGQPVVRTDRATLYAKVDRAVSDYSRDIEDRDTAYFAAAAWAGDASLPAGEANTRRLAFWEWWLTEAVPAAWASVPEE